MPYVQVYNTIQAVKYKLYNTKQAVQKNIKTIFNLQWNPSTRTNDRCLFAFNCLNSCHAEFFTDRLIVNLCITVLLLPCILMWWKFIFRPDACLIHSIVCCRVSSSATPTFTVVQLLLNYIKICETSL